MTSLAVRIRSEIRSLRDRLLMIRHMIHHYRDVVLPLREEIVDLTQREYNYMLVGVFDLLSARQEEFKAQEAYIQAIQDYWTTYAALERAVGGRLPADSASGLKDQDEPKAQAPSEAGQAGADKVPQVRNSKKDHLH
jgi:cobalt-zinc-cadmium efflux system outer membrane protein